MSIQTYKEAVTIMEHPRFGDDRCIEARDVMRLAGRLREARRKYTQFCDEVGRLAPDHKSISQMTVAQIERELQELTERLDAIASKAGNGVHLVKRA